MSGNGRLSNYIGGEWRESGTSAYVDVVNPATTEVLGQVPLSPAGEVEQAVAAAAGAFPNWRRTPPVDRIKYLFSLRDLLLEHYEELARTITMESGKILDESRGEMLRAVENVEVACGIPLMMQGRSSEDIASGIDEFMMRQPLGVCGIVTPFNFPGMIPFWFFPYAIACGNTVVVKPSERTPLTMHRVFELLDQSGLPPGVVNLVNGAREAVDGILDHPDVRAVSFVGSTPVAKYIYSRGTSNGKRVQAHGGAKNPLIVLPDAEMEMTSQIVADSAFGSAGQRCLAGSLALTVGEAREPFSQAIAEAAKRRVVGYGLDEGTEMGPVITGQSKERIQNLIQKAADEGARLLVDGRNPTVRGYEKGFFVRPTVLQDLPPASEVAETEIFGPVLSLVHVDTVDEAIALVNRGRYGNMACLFTTSGPAARKFRYEANVGNVGVNIGVAAPMAWFPFSGWRESFFGTMHGQGMDAVEFFTQKKVVIERWPKTWSRKF